jgi:hypothetical protein
MVEPVEYRFFISQQTAVFQPQERANQKRTGLQPPFHAFGKNILVVQYLPDREVFNIFGHPDELAEDPIGLIFPDQSMDDAGSGGVIIIPHLKRSRGEEGFHQVAEDAPAGDGNDVNRTGIPAEHRDGFLVQHSLIESTEDDLMFS